MFMKPWKYENVMFGEYFWNTTKQTTFYERLKKIQQDYTDAQRKNDELGFENLLKLALNIADSDTNYRTLVLKKPRVAKQIVMFEDEEDEEGCPAFDFSELMGDKRNS